MCGQWLNTNRDFNVTLPQFSVRNLIEFSLLNHHLIQIGLLIQESYGVSKQKY